MVTGDAAAFTRPFASHWLELPGGRYHYLDEGASDRPALMMVHGNPTWAFYFRHLVSAFRERYRVIVPDHMGCGLSDKPRDYPYTLEQHIRNLEALVSHLDLEGMTLLMHDWGGAIAMGYATRHPDSVARCVVFNSAAFYLPRCPLRIRICRVPVFGALLVRGMNGFLHASFRYATSRPERFSEEVRAGYLAPYPDWNSRVAIHAFVKDIPLETRHPTRGILDDIDRKLASLSGKPMLILWGADDFCFTKTHFLPEWRRRFADAECHVLDGTGHYVVEDAHERIVPLIDDFLKRTATRPS
ncbi:MAG: alpha/beta fold hydrolase [Gammaproteobacteria bacterium]|nr:alpha/beta fold hydrolase [Gammaproteobacteria bacterium]